MIECHVCQRAMSRRKSLPVMEGPNYRRVCPECWEDIRDFERPSQAL